MPAVNFENRIPYPFGTVCCKYLSMSTDIGVNRCEASAGTLL